MSNNAMCSVNEHIGAQTPQPISNPPGLTAISYRVGVYEQFKQSMIARIGDPDLPALSSLKTYQADDFTLALLDVWSVVADVITFYQERTANEAYLQTATERGSLLELARLVGYLLEPGVAANTYLAFTLEEAPGSPEQTMIDTGSQVQSLPGPGEEPQTFETTEPIVARSVWNAIQPVSTQPQQVYKSSLSLVLQGIGNNLRPGDSILIVGQHQDTKPVHLLQRVKKVVVDNATQQTTVLFESLPSQNNASATSTASATVTAKVTTGLTTKIALADAFRQPHELKDETVRNLVLNQQIQQRDLEALALVQRWSTRDVFASVAVLSQQNGHANSGVNGANGTGSKNGAGGTLAVTGETSQEEPLTDVHIFVLRQQVPLFGYTAPLWSLLPKGTRESYATYYKSQNPNDQRNPNTDAQWTDWPLVPPAVNQLDLNTTYSQVLQDSWVVVKRYDATGEHLVYAQVESVRDVTVTTFMQSSRATHLSLRITEGDRAAPTSMSDIRQTTVCIQSEELALANVAATTPVQSKNILVNGKFEGLDSVPTRLLAITGQQQDLAGTKTSELATLVSVTSSSGNTTLLTLESDLANAYIPSTVTINANVARATQGESVENEILGSGDTSQPYQRFTLQEGPLTYVQASTASGRASTLSILVDDIPWKEVPSLVDSGPRDHVYTTHLEDDGSVRVQFGDGTYGARLPTGDNNVVANYRKGVGQQALVNPGQINLLLTRPLGLKSAFNPLSPTGAINPETPDDARRNAATTVFTLGRVVSKSDYEQFVMAFTGIAKAQATIVWNDQVRRVFITIAGPTTPDQPIGTEITTGSALYRKIASSLHDVSDPAIPFKIVSYRTALFRMAVSVKIDPNQAGVLSAVGQKLRASFSFDARIFGQSVTSREVIDIIQTVPGVITARVDLLYRVGDAQLKNDVLVADSLSLDSNGRPKLAELLILSPIQPFDALEELL